MDVGPTRAGGKKVDSLGRITPGVSHPCVAILRRFLRLLGMHSRKIYGDLIDLFFRHGCSRENEKPTRFDYNRHASSLEAMTVMNGTQVWRNPRHCT
jgi:hypothetical protein